MICTLHCYSALQRKTACSKATEYFTTLVYAALDMKVKHIIIWRSISMRAGPASLQFDWSKAGLSMDLPVFVYLHTKTSLKFLSRQGRHRAAFYVVKGLLTLNHAARILLGSCFVWTYICQSLLIIEIVICIHYLIVSSPHAVRPTSPLRLSKNM